MGLFTKKKEDENGSEIPKLPELPGKNFLPPPRIPESNDDSESDNYETSIHQLPSFPSNGFGNKFSQNTIKNAVSGDPKEDSEEKEEIPEEFKISPPEKISEPPARLTQEYKEIKIPERKMKKSAPKTIEEEPIFIRIDKFEESLKVFNRVKGKISEIETLLNQTKELKSKEDEQLSGWEEEIQKLKTQIEKVDEDIFSKIE